MDLSVIIITLNEEKNIARAIKSVSFANEILVIDSNSDDMTVQIAKELGAKVYSQEFLGFGQQKNWALDKCKNDWVLWLDADEEIDEQCALEIKNVIKNNQSSEAFYAMNRKTQFIDKWITHGGWYPDFIIRLFNKKNGKFSEPKVHEKIVDNNGNTPKASTLDGHILHYSFPTIESQIKTNQRYAKLGAAELLRKNPNGPVSYTHLTLPTKA